MQFHIRDILWLTFFVAVAVAWWLDRRVTASRLDDLHNQIQTEREAVRLRTSDLESMLKVEQIERREALHREKYMEFVTDFYQQQARKFKKQAQESP